MLKLINLTKDFGGLRAVDHCSFEVPQGAIFGLIGPNGSGKSTIFNLVTGFLPVTEGEVYFRGERITGLPPYQIVRRGIARTFQMVRVFRGMTVLDNMLLGPQQQMGENVLAGVLGLPAVRRQEAENLARARDLLSLMGLQRFENDFVGNLSYAEQKMVEIARALMTDPDLIMLDEPASGINPTLLETILGHIRRLRDEHGKTILIVEHDMSVIMSLCDRIAVLDHGQKICEGTPGEVSCNARVIDAYLGV
jgi:ABC-type branched-subunit amino acid transport system ATPase component